LVPFTYKNKYELEIASKRFITEISTHINDEYLNAGSEMSLIGDYLMETIPYYDPYVGTVDYLDGTKIYVINMQACNT
jgi:hypothetical protein